MTRAELVKEASIVTIGGSEDEAKERVKALFKPSHKDKYAGLRADELSQLEDEHELDKWLEFIQTQAKAGK